MQLSCTLLCQFP